MWFATDDEILQNLLKAALAPVAMKKVRVVRGKADGESGVTGGSAEPSPVIISLVIKKAGLTGPLLMNRSLPSQLRVLDLESNKICGEVDLSCMPPTLETLNLSYNELSGSMRLDALPADLRSLKLHANRFSGRADLSKLPANLTEAFLHENQIVSFVIEVSGQQGRMQGAAPPNLVLGGNGGADDDDDDSLRVLDVSSLPESLRLLNLSSNPLKHKTRVEGKRKTLTVWV